MRHGLRCVPGLRRIRRRERLHRARLPDLIAELDELKQLAVAERELLAGEIVASEHLDGRAERGNRGIEGGERFAHLRALCALAIPEPPAIALGPPELMSAALREIRRVLRPDGLAYVSEPVFAGDFTEVLRIFHDESRVRTLAFEAVKAAVADGTIELVEQVFFGVPVTFADFAEFERLVIGATHTQHRLSADQRARVRERFGRHQSAEGARFVQPMRVDLLRRPA